jgi:GTP-binding protein Era
MRKSSTTAKADKPPAPLQTFAGFAALIGAPNAGKSTLLNRMVGQKLSIVSPKAQTTRMRVLGLVTRGATQIGLLDTPGLFTGKTGSHQKLEQLMQNSVWQSLEDANATVFLVDCSQKQPDLATDAVVQALVAKKHRAFLALNKVDKVNPQTLLPLAERLNDTGIFDEIFMISAKTGDGVDALLDKLISRMPAGPWLYPADELSDLSERLLAAEATREQLFLQLRDELPYEAAVLPESWENKKDKTAVVHQTIVVTRTGHRAIVLGKNGAQIKKIGMSARKEIADLLGRPVHLFLNVRVDETWQEKKEFYRLFGLED